MYISIYQIDMDRDPNNLAFMDLERTKRIQGSADIDSSIYDKVFEGSVRAGNLEDVYSIFNQAHPEGYIGRSLSVSDVVQVVEDNPFGSHFYFCDSFGFSRVDFDTSKTQDLLAPPIDKNSTIYLTARLGISLEVSFDELQQLKKGDFDAQKLLVNLVQSDRCKMGGDTYFPDGWNEGYLDEELNFDLPEAPLSDPAKKKPSLEDTLKADQADLLRAYDCYISTAADAGLLTTGWTPVCVQEFYDCEYQNVWNPEKGAESFSYMYDYVEAMNKAEANDLSVLEDVCLPNVTVYKQGGEFLCQFTGEKSLRPIRSDIWDINAGDAFIVGKNIYCAKDDAHQDFDEPHAPWIVYDTKDNGWFEEDVVPARLGIQAIVKEHLAKTGPKPSLTEKIRSAENKNPSLQTTAPEKNSPER